MSAWCITRTRVCCTQFVIGTLRPRPYMVKEYPPPSLTLLGGRATLSYGSERNLVLYIVLSLSLSLSSIHWRLSAFCWPFSLDSRDVANARSVTRHPLYMGLLISYNTARHVINRRKLFDLTSRFRSGAPECVIPRRFPAHDWRRCKSNALISHRLFHSGSNGNGTFMSSRWRKGKKIPCPFKHIR